MTTGVCLSEEVPGVEEDGYSFFQFIDGMRFCYSDYSLRAGVFFIVAIGLGSLSKGGGSKRTVSPPLAVTASDS